MGEVIRTDFAKGQPVPPRQPVVRSPLSDDISLHLLREIEEQLRERNEQLRELLRRQRKMLNRAVAEAARLKED